MKPKVLALPPDSHFKLMFRPAAWDALNEEFEVWLNPTERHLGPQHPEVAARLTDCHAVLTGWGAGRFERDVLQAAPQLQIVAHTAGSVKHLFSDQDVREVLMPRGLVVFSGNDGLAINVAEATIGLMIMASRRWTQHISHFREAHRTIAAVEANGQFLTGARVGLVSLSKVARYLLPLLRPFGCSIAVYDPYLSDEAARNLDITKMELDDLFSYSDILSVHTPDLPQTHNLIGRDQLSRLRDGATFINTARGRVVDHDALLHECRDGRILVALDVTEPEPLPPDAELWHLPNVILMPHIAGAGHAGYFAIGEAALQALRDHFANRPLRGAVPLDRWETLA